MKNKFNTGKRILFLTVVSAFLVVLCWTEVTDANTSPVEYVNIFTGTSYSTTPSAIKFSKGTESFAQTVPAVSLPNAQTTWTPQTRGGQKKCEAPYYYTDSLWSGFRASHWVSGSCLEDYGSFTLMPVSGQLKCTTSQRAIPFDHSNEEASPYHYSLTTDNGITSEMCGLSHSAKFRFQYDTDSARYLIIQINNNIGKGFLSIDTEKKEITGYNPIQRQYRMKHLSGNMSGYFILRLDCEIESYGTFSSDTVTYGDAIIDNAPEMGIWIRLKSDILNVDAGTSFTSINNARLNMEHELKGKSFDNICSIAMSAWNKALSAINIHDVPDERKRIFYTALYHSMLLPRVMNDHNGQYPLFSEKGTGELAYAGNYYDDFSMWDIYRATLPLYTILDKKKTSDFVSSFIIKYNEGGWLPVFPIHNNYSSAMIGDHATSFISDAWQKGIRGFDDKTVCEAMIKNAFQTPDKPEYQLCKGRRALDTYCTYGYIPLEDDVPDAYHTNEQVSRTLEYAYNDFAVSCFLEKHGYTDEVKALKERSGNWRSVVDPDSKWVRGRYADGKWITPFDPDIKQSYITEGTPRHYTWYVPHDVKGLIDEIGEPLFVSRLDSMFTQGYYWHGNEPGHQIPYLFNWAGMPWKTQQYVNSILAEEYSDGPGGLCGNEDAGQISSWYVFSSLGFYPVCPGVAQYAIGTPSYPKAEIIVGDNKLFRIIAENLTPENIYIQSAELNGRPYDKSYIEHSDLIAGGVLRFRMGDTPNKKWASSEKSAPYSLSNE